MVLMILNHLFMNLKRTKSRYFADFRLYNPCIYWPILSNKNDVLLARSEVIMNIEPTVFNGIGIIFEILGGSTGFPLDKNDCDAIVAAIDWCKKQYPEEFDEDEYATLYSNLLKGNQTYLKSNDFTITLKVLERYTFLNNGPAYITEIIGPLDEW